ncbi:MAG: mercuric transporter MerT family protein [Thermoanaerobaculia bacterium]
MESRVASTGSGDVDFQKLGVAGAAASGAGGALLATLASACCVGPVLAPLVVAVLGASGAAWAAGLKPYSPYLLGGSFLLLVYGFRTVYRRRQECADGTCPAAPARGVRWVLWCAATLWTTSVGFNLWVWLEQGW